jgi:hypothetical protein
MKLKRWLVTGTVTAVAGLGVALPATAGAWEKPPPPEEGAKCNAGNGNGSESLADTGHCFMGDPGNSFSAGNRGGDEVPPGVENPGGNNVGPLD